MDSFLNLAKKGYEAYSESQSDVSKTGGQEYNSPHHSQQGGSRNDNDRPHINNGEAIEVAQRNGSGDSSLFSSALSHLSSHKSEHEEPIDEEHVQNAHQKAYQEDSAGSLSAGSMGSAAALQVLKQFTSGGGSGGGSQTELISMAMAEATKLFDKSGGSASGDKQDVVNSAAMTVMKLLVQSKFSAANGGSSSGGLGSLLGLAKNFI